LLLKMLRRSDLDVLKHGLVLKKKACRAQTTASWKRMRQEMEQQLVAKLDQEQQQLLEEHLRYLKVRTLENKIS
jgi:hypothetical protein